LVPVRVRTRMRALALVQAKALERLEVVMKVAGQGKKQALVRAADWAKLQARTVVGVKIQAVNQPVVEPTARGHVRVNAADKEFDSHSWMSLGVVIQDSM
jgi:hypothetical protein